MRRLIETCALKFPTILLQNGNKILSLLFLHVFSVNNYLFDLKLNFHENIIMCGLFCWQDTGGLGLSLSDEKHLTTH